MPGLSNNTVQIKTGFFHALSTVLTKSGNPIGNEKYKSAHSVRSNEIWMDDIAFAGYTETILTLDDAFQSALDEASANAAVTVVGSTSSRAVLYPLANTDYETWFFDTGTPSTSGSGFFPSSEWVKPLISPSSIVDEEGSPSVGYNVRLYRPTGEFINYDLASYDVDYYSGLVKFDPNKRPIDSGNGLYFQLSQSGLETALSTDFSTAKQYLIANSAGGVVFQYTGQYLSDFNDVVSDVVFDSSNFVDSSSVDFDVTTGATVSADVKVNTATGLTVSASGVEINYGTGLTVSGNQLVVDSSTFGVQDADNGLSIDGSSNVVLGGTLSVDTTINGGQNSFGLTFDEMSEFTVNTDTNINLSAGSDANIYVDNGLSIISGTLTASTSNLSIVAANGVYTDTDSTPEGLKYADSGYVTDDRSLTDKEYVDDAISAAQTATTYFATDGITLTGNTFSLATTAAGDGLTYSSGVLAVNVNSDALEIVSDTVQLKSTIIGNRTFSDSVTITGNLTVNGTTTTINTEQLTVEDNIITLNGTFSGTPTLDSGIEVNRGTGATVSLLWDESTDYWSVIGTNSTTTAIITEAGTGLTKNGNELSINTSGFSTVLAGVGLTANGAALDVRAGNGLTVDSTQDRVELGGNLSVDTTIGGQNSFGLTFDEMSEFTVNTENDINLSAGSDVNISTTYSVNIGTSGAEAIKVRGSDVFLENTTTDNLENTVLLIDSSDKIVSRELGSGAFSTASFAITLDSYDELKAYSGVYNTVRVFPDPTAIPLDSRLPGVFRYVTESPLNVPVELLDDLFYNRPPIVVNGATLSNTWKLPTDNSARIINNRLELVNYQETQSAFAASIDLDIPTGSTIGTKYIVYYEAKVESGNFRVVINSKLSDRVITATASRAYIDEIVTDGLDNTKLFIRSTGVTTASIFNIRVDMILDADDAIVFRSLGKGSTASASGQPWTGYWVKELGESISINHYDISSFFNDKPVRNLLAVCKKLGKVALFDNDPTVYQLRLQQPHTIECDVDTFQGLPGSDSLIVNYLNGANLFSINIDEFDFFKRVYLAAKNSNKAWSPLYTATSLLYNHLVLRHRFVEQITVPDGKIQYTYNDEVVERWCAAFKVYDPEDAIAGLGLFFVKDSNIAFEDAPANWSSQALHYAYVSGDNLFFQNSGNFLVHCYERIDSDYTMLYGVNHTIDGLTGNSKNATIEQPTLKYATICIRSQPVEQRLVEEGRMGALPTMRTKLFRLPSVKSYTSRHPIHDESNNTSAFVFKQCRTLTIDSLNVKFCKYALTFQGSNSIDGGEGFAFNTIMVGALLNNGNHIRLMPSINRGDGVVEIGQSGTFIGGYTNQNFFQGGNLTNNAQYLDDNTSDHPAECFTFSTDEDSIVYGVTMSYRYWSKDLQDYVQPQVGDIFEFPLGGRKAEFITDVTVEGGPTSSGTTFITIKNTQDVQVNLTDLASGRIRYANREGYSMLEGYSNVGRIVGRPDGNIFINCAFEDRGLVGEYLMDLNGVRRSTFLNCRYEVGQAYDNFSIRRPSIYLNGCDYNTFNEGTGLDERKLFIGEYSAYSNTFLSSGHVEYDGGIPSADRKATDLLISDIKYTNSHIISNKKIINVAATASFTVTSEDNASVLIIQNPITVDCNSELGSGFNCILHNISGSASNILRNGGTEELAPGDAKELIFITATASIFK